jgi:hypothetical protein
MQKSQQSSEPAMTDLIRRHNRLNGILFSIVEFAFIALVMAVFITLHVVHRNFTFAVIEFGIALNCLPVVVIGVRMLKERDEAGKVLGSFWNKEARQQLLKENPHMLWDTLSLTSATLIPFLSFAIVLCEIIFRR